MTLRAGFIGCGDIAEKHAAALLKAGGVEIAASHDVIPERAAAFAERFGGAPAQSAAAVIRRADVVYICTRHDSHVELIEQAAAAGRAIFCEKPLAIDWAGALRAARAVHRAGVPFGIGYNHRWARANLEAARALRQAGEPPFHIHLRMACAPFMEGWPSDPVQGGGVLVCLGSHAFDLLQFLHDRTPEAISCQTARRRLPEGSLPDTAVAWVRYPDGCLATVALHDHAPPSFALDPGGELLAWEVVTAGGRAYRGGSLKGWEAWGVTRLLQRPAAEPGLTGFDAFNETWGYAPQARAFIESLNERRPFAVGLRAALLAAAQVEAASQSARQGGVPTAPPALPDLF